MLTTIIGILVVTLVVLVYLRFSRSQDNHFYKDTNSSSFDLTQSTASSFQMVSEAQSQQELQRLKLFRATSTGFLFNSRNKR